MQIHNVHELITFDNGKVSPKVLMNRPGYRLVVLNLRRGQSVPEHANNEMVTVYAISGRITFYEAGAPFELRSGHVLFIEGGTPHSLEAHEDSTLLVVAAGPAALSGNPELDLREVPRPQRHPLVFSRFDALSIGESFEVINDHDPIPLNKQLNTMRPEQAEWTYIVRGPEMFRIRIRRIAPLSGQAFPAPVQPEALLGIHR
ncbi:MAG: DUF2249 domain-containing protein [Terracidiphilus sp.]